MGGCRGGYDDARDMPGQGAPGFAAAICMYSSHTGRKYKYAPGPRWTIRKKEQINLIEPHMWPPSSPDINPVDYAVWDALQQRVYHQRQFKMVEELKRATVTEWHELSQRFIDNSINEWRRRKSSIATWLRQQYIILILSKDMFNQ